MLELDSASGDVELMVTGLLYDGTEFFASDCIRIVPPNSPDPQSGRLTVASNLEGAWADVQPMDLTIDGGGFADFVRDYQDGTTVTLTAEETFGVRTFKRWWIDGEAQPQGQLTIQVTVDELHDASMEYNVPKKPIDTGSGQPL
jgi:hypothetical protein